MTVEVSVCIVSYNCAMVIGACLDTIPAGIPVLIIDNGSKDDSIQVARAIRPDAVIVDHGKNIGFGSGHNRILAMVQTPFALLLNPDTTLAPDTIKSLLATAQEYPKASIIGGVHVHDDGSEEICFKPFERGLQQPKSVTMVSGALMLLRMTAFDGNFFDENIFLYYEDDDLCYQTRKNGWDVMIDPHARYTHAVSHSSGSSLRGAWFRGYHTARSHYYTKKKNNDLDSKFASKMMLRKSRHLVMRLLTFKIGHVANLYGQICGYREAAKNK
jgi:N-acetylglucosaminyl-diphospho-decaprenol L-rhamnosyltransferase